MHVVQKGICWLMADINAPINWCVNKGSGKFQGIATIFSNLQWRRVRKGLQPAELPSLQTCFRPILLSKHSVSEFGQALILIPTCARDTPERVKVQSVFEPFNRFKHGVRVTVYEHIIFLFYYIEVYSLHGYGSVFWFNPLLFILFSSSLSAK